MVQTPARALKLTDLMDAVEAWEATIRHYVEMAKKSGTVSNISQLNFDRSSMGNTNPSTKYPTPKRNSHLNHTSSGFDFLTFGTDIQKKVNLIMG